jgi:hypothetical protein
MKMHYLTLTAILGIFAFTNSFSQINIYLASKDFNLNQWVAIDSLHRKIEFLTDSIKNLDSIKVVLEIKQYNILDINSDGYLDVFYKGLPGQKSGFMINTDYELEMEYEVSESIINIGRAKPWNPINFQTLIKKNNSENEVKYYIPVFRNGKLTYEVENTLLFHPNLVLINENVPPVGFEILQIPELRWAATSEATNVIKMYKGGDRGFAVASSADSNRRIWWLVLMDEGSQTYRVGWMLRKNLKQLPRQ